MRYSAAILASLGLCACAVTVPVDGALQRSGESFMGEATGYVGGAGELRIITSRGTRCAGRFVYVTRREGSGTFRCDDGRTGPFTFASAGSSGTGSGTLAGDGFTFTFGP